MAAEPLIARKVRALCTAAAGVRGVGFRLLPTSPEFCEHAETDEACIHVLRWVATLRLRLLRGPMDTAAGSMRTLRPCISLLPGRPRTAAHRVNPGP